jgi:hypothetical protein
VACYLTTDDDGNHNGTHLLGDQLDDWNGDNLMGCVNCDYEASSNNFRDAVSICYMLANKANELGDMKAFTRHAFAWLMEVEQIALPDAVGRIHDMGQEMQIDGKTAVTITDVLHCMMYG